MRTTRAPWNICSICEDCPNEGDTAMRAVSRERSFSARKLLAEVRKCLRELCGEDRLVGRERPPLEALEQWALNEAATLENAGRAVTKAVRTAKRAGLTLNDVRTLAETHWDLVEMPASNFRGASPAPRALA